MFRYLYGIQTPNAQPKLDATCELFWTRLDNLINCVVSSPHRCRPEKGDGIDYLQVVDG